MNRIALIPAYQPDRTLETLAAELIQKGFSVVVVDDGSGPAYKSLFDHLNPRVILLRHSENRGKGAALKTGLNYIREQFPPPYLVVTADADGQHQLPDILSVCAAGEASSDSLVLGSRRFDGKVPLKSRLGNTMTRLIYRLSSGVRVYDTQTGLRCFSHRLMDRMRSIEGDRYEYEMNVLMQAARSGIPIREVWIKTVYLNGNASSHFHPVRDSCRIFREILRFSASSLCSFLVDYSLFCLLSAATGLPAFSNIAARLVSAVVNFNLNRRLVFDAKGHTLPLARNYFLLAAFLLLCSTALLHGLTLSGLAPWIAKLLTESLLFTFSYLMQHHVIFRKERTA